MENLIKRTFQDFCEEADVSVFDSDLELIAKKTTPFLELIKKYHPSVETSYQIHGSKPVIEIQMDLKLKHKVVLYKFTVQNNNFIVYMKSGSGYLTNDKSAGKIPNQFLSEEKIFERLKQQGIPREHKLPELVQPTNVPIPNFADIMTEQEKEKEENSKCHICERTNHVTKDCRSPKRCKYTPCVSGDSAHSHDKQKCSRVN